MDMRGRPRRFAVTPMVSERRNVPLVRGRHLNGKALRAVPRSEAAVFIAKVRERLWEERERQGIPRSEMAAALGVTERTVWGWETDPAYGHPHVPQLHVLYQWATALGIRPMDLLDVGP